MSLELACWHKNSATLSLAEVEMFCNVLQVSDMSLHSIGTSALGCVGDLSGAE
jgi:hypothetical protein